MKTLRNPILLAGLCLILSSCNALNKTFSPKYGCGTNGKNVGAEKLLDGSVTKKQPKFKA